MRLHWCNNPSRNLVGVCMCWLQQSVANLSLVLDVPPEMVHFLDKPQSEHSRHPVPGSCYQRLLFPEAALVCEKYCCILVDFAGQKVASGSFDATCCMRQGSTGHSSNLVPACHKRSHKARCLRSMDYVAHCTMKMPGQL